jgi:diguanylate cyclase (GGDEF)-like protein
LLPRLREAEFVLLTLSIGMAFLAVLGLLAFYLAARVLLLLESLRQASCHVRSLEEEAAQLRDVHSLLLQDREFLNQFLRQFPHLTRELHSGIREREIPRVLLNVAVRSLAPRQALVLIRRRATEGDQALPSRFVVAAASPEGGTVRVGTEIALGEGELGFVAEAQRVMNRQNLDAEAGLRRSGRTSTGLTGFIADLVAPMVFDEETLGLIALVQPQRTSEDAKSALRLVAQTGAQALRNAAAYTHMKITADVDGLTGVFNKRKMTQMLAECLHAAETKGKPLSVFLFDIDNFKHYNDTNGHPAGDALLKQLAGLVQKGIRQDDIFGRFGGEEFLLIFRDSTLQGALAAAHKIREKIASHSFAFAERQPLGVLSVSGGVAEFPGDAHGSSRLLQAADEALYQAKRQGRNRVLPASRHYLSEGGQEAPAPGSFGEREVQAVGSPRVRRAHDPNATLIARPRSRG